MAAGRPYPEQKARAERCGAEWLWQPSTKRALNTGVDTARSAAQSTDKRTAVPALLVETSGSSAGAKIVMLDDAALYASGTAINARLGLARGDLWLCCLPRQHVGGLAIGYRCALAGAAWRLLPRFEVEAVAQALTTEAVTHISLVPAMLQRLLEQDVPPAPTLRVALMGGQALDPNLAARAIAAGWPLYLGYGMTETFSQVAGDWIDASGRPEQGLQPLEGVQLRIAPEPAAQATSDLIGETPSHSAHTKGVLTLRGPMLMIGYASPSRRPGQGLQQGWLTSHDLAHVESTGKLHVLGRADDTLVIAGRNVQPSEVEARLTALEGLGEVAVLGLPDPVWGHRLIAVYTGPRATASVEAWCRSELPSPLRPRAFLRIESLPSRPSGKRDKQALMHLVGSHLPDVSTMASQ
jgi:O-succinylbenzoic acid--CoA ligase